MTALKPKNGRELRSGSPGLLLLVVVVSVSASGFWLLRDQGPSRAQIQAAAEALRALHRPNEQVLLFPAYATQAREFLGDLDPLAVREPWLEDLAATRSVSILALFGEGELLRERFSALGWGEHRLPPGTKSQAWFDEVELMKFSNPSPQQTKWRLIEHLKDARVRHETPDGTPNVPCTKWIAPKPNNPTLRQTEKWRCPKDGEWFFVGSEWHRMGEHPRFCLWAHPPMQGALHIRVPNVPLGGELVITGGHTLNSSRRARAAVHLEAALNDGPRQPLIFGLEDTWRTFRIKTSTAGNARLDLRVTSPDAGANHFCFLAETRSAP